MQIAVNIENDTIAQKVLWFLNHLKNDGVEVIKIDEEFKIDKNLCLESLTKIKQKSKDFKQTTPTQLFKDLDF